MNYFLEISSVIYKNCI